jgi:hypothetical protein
MTPVIEATESASMIEDGTYEVVCVSVVEDYLENSQYDPNVIRFGFGLVPELLKQDGTEFVLDPIASHKLSPQSKLWSWCVALGTQPVIGQSLDTDVLIGKHAMARVEAAVRPDGTKGFPKVVDLMAMPRRVVRMVPPVRAPQAAEPLEPGEEEAVAEPD